MDGWSKGRTWCCSSARPAADLWKEFWHLAEDVGTDHISIQKCKGHATAGTVQAGRATEFTRVANDNADHFAGNGAELAERQSPSVAEKARYAEARKWYQWLMAFCAEWPEDAQRATEKADCTLPGPPLVVDVEKACKDVQERARLRGHELVSCRRGKGVMCSRCQESRPATDVHFWQETTCAGAHGHGSLDLAILLAQEEKG